MSAMFGRVRANCAALRPFSVPDPLVPTWTELWKLCHVAGVTILVLTLRPQGLLGERVADRA